jgi:arabinogalactan endo-1,4-beta-galactosidase
MVRRSLFDTLRMLRKEGIAADARIVGNEVVVSMAYPVPGGAAWTRKFARNELARAADAVATAAMVLYPTCALAKVGEVIASALALAQPRAS